MVHTQTLSALDLAFFVLESRERTSNVGPLAILKRPPRARSGRAFADRLLRAMAKQPVGHPSDMRFRPPGLNGLPRLAAVQSVDVRQHCHRHTLAAPADDATLFEFVCRLHEERLDRSRPHWELHVIDGLAEGRVALYFKVHHGTLDGRGLVASLDAEGLRCEVFSDVEPDPGYELVLSGVARLRQCNAQAVLAIGGGSPIDCAKAINLSAANDCHPSKLAGLWLYAAPRRRGLPFYAVPTTAGTGSEVTMAALMSDKQAQSKRLIVDPKLLPHTGALDPRLTVGLPKAVTAATGMDALTHGVEAYLSTRNPQTDAWALAAARLITRHLPRAYADGRDIAAREGLLLGSYYAGLALTRTGVGYVHALSHQLGALYHLTHGVLNAIVMPRVLEHSIPRCVSRMAALARAAGLASDGDGSSLSDEALARAFVGRVRELSRESGIPAQVQALRAADFDRIIDNAFAEAHGTYGVPRYLRRDEAWQPLSALAPV